MKRLITNGDPAQINEAMGLANNMLFREASNTGASVRKIVDGIEIRINPGGINQVIINKPGRQEPVALDKEKETTNAWTVIYAYEGSKYGAVSALSRDSITEKSYQYFGTAPAYDLSGILNCNTIIILEPQRILTTTEARIFNKLLSAGRNIFIFPGTDTEIYNAVLAQLGSNLRLIPMTVKDGVLTVITADTRTRYCIPVRWRGFLHPVSDHALSSAISDPFGKMMATADVVSMSPVFYHTHTDYVYVYGSELLAHLQSDNGGGGADINFIRNPYITEAIYPDNWTTLSESDIENWLSVLAGDFFRATPVGYTLKKDSNGYYTYEEKDTYDFSGSSAAYEKGKTLYAHSYSPYWLLPGYAQYLDDVTDVKDFCKWMNRPQNVNEGAFGNVFYPLFPYYYKMGIDEGWEMIQY